MSQIRRAQRAYHCHACEHNFRQLVDLNDLTAVVCPACQCDFIEETKSFERASGADNNGSQPQAAQQQHYPQQPQPQQMPQMSNPYMRQQTFSSSQSIPLPAMQLPPQMHQQQTVHRSQSPNGSYSESVTYVIGNGSNGPRVSQTQSSSFASNGQRVNNSNEFASQAHAQQQSQQMPHSSSNPYHNQQEPPRQQQMPHQQQQFNNLPNQADPFANFGQIFGGLGQQLGGMFQSFGQAASGSSQQRQQPGPQPSQPGQQQQQWQYQQQWDNSNNHNDNQQQQQQQPNNMGAGVDPAQQMFQQVNAMFGGPGGINLGQQMGNVFFANGFPMDGQNRPGSQGGCTQDFIDNLPQKDSEKESDCYICLEKCKDGAESVQLPCKHAFDKSCIVNWLKDNDTCPVCRVKLNQDRPQQQQQQQPNLFNFF